MGPGVNFLRRTRLARGGVAVKLGLLGSAVQSHTFKHPA